MDIIELWSDIAIADASDISGFTLIEDSIEIGGPYTLATLIDDKGDMLRFNGVRDDAFTLVARQLSQALLL